MGGEKTVSYKALQSWLKRGQKFSNAAPLILLLLTGMLSVSHLDGRVFSTKYI